jgi:hypothetical protein
MTRYTKLTELDVEWVGKWARKVNDDKVLRVIGRFLRRARTEGTRSGSVEKRSLFSFESLAQRRNRGRF